MKLLTTIATLSTLAWPAVAEDRAPCKPLDKMQADLASEFREVLTGAGVTEDGNILMQFQSEGGATYTIVLVSPRKVACIMEFGTNWQTRHDAPAVPEQGS